MANEKITVMIVPRSSGELKQFSIPVRLLWATGVLGVLFVLVNLFLLADYFDKRVDKAKFQRMVQENKFLTAQFEGLTQTISDLKGDFNLLVAKEKVIRTIFDLPEIDPEARMLGVGGPADSPFDSVSATTATALGISLDVDELLRLARFEQDRYQEVYDLLTKRRDQMDHTPSIMPTRGYISRGFGASVDPFTGLDQFHSGVDIANGIGTPVYATANGRVASAGLYNGLGNTIEIEHGFGYRTRFGHLSRFNVKAGQTVRRGDLIGYMGNSGYSTGPHLHYEVLKGGSQVNPYKYIVNM
jgi:murein DD-endopeptidase MepM/ murein hydrolase activator NlpD